MTAPSTKNINNDKHTVQDFDLVREPTVWETKDTAFIDPYLMLTTLNNSSRYSSSPATTSTPEWGTFKISLPRLTSSGVSRSPKLLNGYAVSPSHHAYVTFCVQLTTTDATRLTPMRYRDMIVDNYVSAFPSTSTPISKLRWLGIANILNEDSRATFTQIFHLAGCDILSRGHTEIFPEIDLNGTSPSNKELRTLLLNDPFTRGVLALLHHHAQDLNHAFVKRFIFISDGWEANEYSTGPSPLELRLNLVVELARLGDTAPAVTTDALKEPLANL
ncbi:hypothetical protein E0Z10_g5341 [Xylaria hypoxylon]|uniref:Uncharacterized protein n=1 Tax=Xylaria hypoxylon TaxID=37992 RepID=A0A4Z0YGG6_9PEZI|nr:hypothetical protein E0Z10_g5341 [Xylaria hypoxylon]